MSARNKREGATLTPLELQASIAIMSIPAEKDTVQLPNLLVLCIKTATCVDGVIWTEAGIKDTHLHISNYISLGITGKNGYQYQFAFLFAYSQESGMAICSFVTENCECHFYFVSRSGLVK